MPWWQKRTGQRLAGETGSDIQARLFGQDGDAKFFTDTLGQVAQWLCWLRGGLGRRAVPGVWWALEPRTYHMYTFMGNSTTTPLPTYAYHPKLRGRQGGGWRQTNVRATRPFWWRGVAWTVVAWLVSGMVGHVP